MRRKIIIFTTLLACSTLVLKFFINADSNVCSNSTTCSTSNGLAYIQLTNATIAPGVQLGANCNPNNNLSGSILKDLSNVLYSPSEQRFIKIDVDYENTHCGDVSFILKCASYGSFASADVTNIAGVTPLHVTCQNGNSLVNDINRIITIGIRNQENFRVKATLEICDMACISLGQQSRVIWQTTSIVYNSLSSVTIPITLNYLSNNYQSCVPVYTCY